MTTPLTLDFTDDDMVRRYMDLYYELFPQWQREPDETVVERHLSGDYVSRGFVNDNGLDADSLVT